MTDRCEPDRCEATCWLTDREEGALVQCILEDGHNGPHRGELFGSEADLLVWERERADGRAH